MRRNYSRLEKVEEKNNIKKAVTLVLVSITTLVLLFFYGIPVLGRFAAFVSDLGKSGKAITQNDKTPPAPPRFSTLPDFTNSQTLDVSGNSEAGANIKLTLNGALQETLTDKDGRFSFTVNLNEGENTFSATAVDTANNVSQETQAILIIFDKTQPVLTIDSPQDGAQFIGTKQRQVTLQGTTESGTQITVNDRFVSVDDSGKFQFTTSLTDGENKFEVKSTDKAGNTTSVTLTLHFVS